MNEITRRLEVDFDSPGKYLLSVRVQRKQKRTFSERHQGTMGIPIQRHFLFGGFVSWRLYRPTERGAWE
jgi:hypothetical protein